MTTAASPHVFGWGFIGASTIAREHMVAAVRAQPGHDVLGIASGNPQRAKEFANELGIARAYDDVASLLADPGIQAVYISSVNEQHFEQAMAAIAAGKHVLCEKPLATRAEEALKMIDAAHDEGLVFATNHHLRNAATHRKIRDLVRDGAIGRPLYARIFHAIYLRPQVQGWRIAEPVGGGVILDIGVHAIDVLRFALDAEPVEVVGLTQQGPLSRNGVADGVMAVVRMDNGVLAQVHAAYTVPYAGTGFEIHGDKGSIVGSGLMTVQPAGEVRLRDADGDHLVPIEHEGLYSAGVRRFCEAIAGKGGVSASGFDGLRSLQVALAMAKACEDGVVKQAQPASGKTIQ